MTIGLKLTGLRFVVCLQEAGWNQARRIQQAVFLPSTFFFQRILQSTRRAVSTRVETVYMHFSAFFNGLSCKRAIAFMCVPG